MCLVRKPSFSSNTNKCSPDLSKFGNDSAEYYSRKYLDVGEKAFDIASAYLGSSDYFKRR